MVGTEWYLWKKKKLLRNLESNQKGWDKIKGSFWASSRGSTITWSDWITTFERLVTKPDQISTLPYFIIYSAKKSIYKYNDVDIAWSGVLTKEAKKSPWSKSRAVKHWGRIVQSQFQFFRNQSFRDSTATRRVNDSTWFSNQCWITF